MNKLLAGYFLLHWSISFSHDGGKSWENVKHQQRFQDQGELITFIRQAPDDGEQFECLESLLREHGLCRFEGMRIANLYKVHEKRNEGE